MELIRISTTCVHPVRSTDTLKGPVTIVNVESMRRDVCVEGGEWFREVGVVGGRGDGREVGEECGEVVEMGPEVVVF